MRTDSRIFAFKFVFGEIFNQNMDGEEQMNILQEEQALNDNDLSFSHEIINAYNQNKDTIKADVENALDGYQLDRVFKADLALIYTAVAEFRHVGTPKPVVVSEILNISKKYSTDKSSGFINGVLAKVN